MPVIQDVGDKDDDTIIRENIASVLTSRVYHKPDYDEEFRKEQKRKKELEAYQRLQKEQTARLELEEKRQIARARLDNEQRLQMAGFSRYGRFPNPHEIFWDLDRHTCLFGCQDEVRYIYERSHNLTSRHSLTLPYEKESEKLHLCKSLSPEQRNIFENIIRMITDLRIALITAQQQSSGFGRMASEANLVSLK